MRCADLQRMADRYVEAARILYAASNWSSSYYLAGYSIEVALKSIIARRFEADTIPDKNLVNSIYTHKFRELLSVSGLKGDYDRAIEKDSRLGSNWSICSEWTPECRYQDKNQDEAHDLLRAINDERHGVLQWIKAYW
jgi:HEPN domain-containing protein